MGYVISTFTAIVVTLCVLLFVVVNLDNLLRYHAGFSATMATSETPEIIKPMAAPLMLAGLGTGVFFLESCLYVILGFWRGLLQLSALNLLGTEAGGPAALAGLFAMVLGYAIFLWSVVVRGRYATSWQMPADHKLVEWGPYRYVRHPSYLGYFLMFAGFFMLWQEALAMIPLIAIPGYVLITQREEEMLLARFGDRYLQYQKNVGRFFPKMRQQISGPPSN
jgi:protein-S-isoprenylcysteine O-methyltransferase Ste14